MVLEINTFFFFLVDIIVLELGEKTESILCGVMPLPPKQRFHRESLPCYIVFTNHQHGFS